MMENAIFSIIIQKLVFKVSTIKTNKFCCRFLPQVSAGFTLIEMLFVITIIGILSAIAAPSWVTFTAQQRVNAVNDAVYRNIQKAQSEAKRTKQKYSISFKTESSEPKVAIYVSNTTPTSWESLSGNLNIKPGQVLLGSNLSSENRAGSSISYALNTPQTITFDYTGTLLPPNATDLGNKGLIIAVAEPQSNNSSQPVSLTRRCVKIITLLGEVQMQRVEGCNP